MARTAGSPTWQLNSVARVFNSCSTCFFLLQCGLSSHQLGKATQPKDIASSAAGRRENIHSLPSSTGRELGLTSILEHAAKINGQRGAFSLSGEINRFAVTADSQNHCCWQASLEVLTPSSSPEEAQPEPVAQDCVQLGVFMGGHSTSQGSLCQHLTTLTAKIPRWLVRASHVMRCPKPNGGSCGSSLM